MMAYQESRADGQQEKNEPHDQKGVKKRMMNSRKEFYEYVKDNVKDYLPDSYQNGEIRIEEVAKIMD